MPTKLPVRNSSGHKKRHGLHHNHGKHYVKVYWPYMPLLLLTLVGMLISIFPGYNNGTLAYASGLSHESLLMHTNS
jgi:hypothetical protein